MRFDSARWRQGSASRIAHWFCRWRDGYCVTWPNRIIMFLLRCNIGEKVAMLAMAPTCSRKHQSPHVLTENEQALWILNLAMAIQKYSISNLSGGYSAAEFEESLRDYLDGYFLASDFYPACTRHLFARNDAYALWNDFLKVAEDLSVATNSMVGSPERFMNLESLTSDELEARKRKAAIRAAEIITEQFSGSTVSDSKSDPT